MLSHSIRTSNQTEEKPTPSAVKQNEKLTLHSRNNIFSVRVTEHWKRLLRKVVASSTELFKTHLGVYLYKLLNLLQQRDWTQSLEVPSLQFCDSYTFLSICLEAASLLPPMSCTDTEMAPLIHVQMILNLSDQNLHSPGFKVFINWATFIPQLALRLAEKGLSQDSLSQQVQAIGTYSFCLHELTM